MRILLDTLGADRGQEIFPKGALAARKKLNVEYTFIGDQEVLRKSIASLNEDPDNFEYIHTETVIENQEEPVRALRRKRDASMVLALRALKEGKGDAMLSCGSTGALLAGGTLLVGRIPGVERPALTVALPNLSDSIETTILLDVGANVDCTGKMLYSFGVMGSEYAKVLLAMDHPTVGLLNIGVEEGKGNRQVQDAYALLNEKFDCFIGNIEARDILFSSAHVVVSDGFSGNVAIKSMEGMAKAMMKVLKEEIYSTTRTKLGGALLKPAFKNIAKLFDSNQYGAAPLLGVKKPIFKAHGSSNAQAVEYGIYALHSFTQQRVIENIELQLKEKEV